MHMRTLLSTAVFAALSVSLVAQDKITLANGDVITGKITSMADGKITISSPLLNDVVVPIANVSDMSTGDTVRLKTKSGDLLPRRIVGIEEGFPPRKAKRIQAAITSALKEINGVGSGLQITQVELGGNSFVTAIDPGESQTFAISCDETCTQTRNASVTITDKKKGIVAKLSRFKVCECGGTS